MTPASRGHEDQVKCVSELLSSALVCGEVLAALVERLIRILLAEGHTSKRDRLKPEKTQPHMITEVSCLLTWVQWAQLCSWGPWLMPGGDCRKDGLYPHFAGEETGLQM